MHTKSMFNRLRFCLFLAYMHISIYTGSFLSPHFTFLTTRQQWAGVKSDVFESADICWELGNCLQRHVLQSAASVLRARGGVLRLL